MTWPTAPSTTSLPAANYDNPLDVPADARAEFLAMKAQVDDLSAKLATLIGHGDPKLITPGRLLAVQRFATVGSAPYTPTAGTKFVIVETQGGGAKGGDAPAATSTSSTCGSGGGAGGYAKALIPGISDLVSGVVTVGRGGDSTNPSGTPSNFNYPALGTQESGPGYAGSSTVAPVAFGSSGFAYRGIGGPSFIGGIGGQLLVTRAGEHGGDALVLGSGSSFVGIVGGHGGHSVFGRGPESHAVDAGQSFNGFDAFEYGTGGGGAVNAGTTTARVGGNGCQGIVLVWEFA